MANNISLEHNVRGFTDLEFFQKLSVFQQKEILDQLPVGAGDGKLPGDDTVPTIFLTREELDGLTRAVIEGNWRTEQAIMSGVMRRIERLREIHQESCRAAVINNGVDDDA